MGNFVWVGCAAASVLFLWFVVAKNAKPMKQPGSKMSPDRPLIEDGFNLKSSELNSHLGSPAESQQKEAVSWDTLDPCILLHIFCRVPHNDLAWNVSNVCKLWQKACFELMFWRQDKLDLRVASPTCSRCNMFGAKTSNLLHVDLNPRLKFPEEEAAKDAKIIRLLRGVLESEGDVFGHDLSEWLRSISQIYIPCDLNLSDQHCRYIAQRVLESSMASDRSNSASKSVSLSPRKLDITWDMDVICF